MKRPKNVVSSFAWALVFAALPLPGLPASAPSAPTDEVLPVQPAAAWTVVPADPAPGSPDGNPHIRRVLDVTTPGGPGIRTEVEGESCVCAACAKAERTFSLSAPRSALGAVLEFHYDTRVTGFFAATSYVLEFYRQGALVGSRGFLGASGGIVDGCTRIDEASPLGEVTLFLDSFLGDAVFDAVKVSLRHYGCEMTGFQVISDLRISSSDCAPGKVHVWVNAASATPGFPYATFRTAARTIQDGLTAANPGSTVYVLRGTYPETLTIGRDLNGLKLNGQSRREIPQTVLDGQTSQTPVTIEEADDILICGFQFRGGLGTRGGGIKVVDSTGITVEHCTFESNHAIFGGGLYAESSRGAIRNCAFKNDNVADRAGGALALKGLSGDPKTRIWKITDCAFADNRTLDGPGGAVAVFGEDEDLNGGIAWMQIISLRELSAKVARGGVSVQAERCVFERNLSPKGSTAGSGNGGALYCDGRRTYVALTDAAFRDNVGGFNGGAVGSVALATVDIRGREIAFERNRAPDGGACYATTLGKVLVTPDEGRRAAFLGNRSEKGFGGAFHATCGGVAELKQCDFTDNSAGMDGGALHAEDGRLELEDVKFLSLPDGPDGRVNSAKRNGGAIALGRTDTGFAFCNAIPTILQAKGFEIVRGRAETGKGGALSAVVDDNLLNKLTVLTLDRGSIVEPMAADGLPGSPADGIYLRNTGEATAGPAREAAAALNRATVFAERYLTGVRLSDRDIIAGVKLTGRAGAGSAVATDAVQDEPLPFRSDEVLRLERCEIMGFRFGVDALDSHRITVADCLAIQGNGTGIRLVATVADVEGCALFGNTLGVDLERMFKLVPGVRSRISYNDISEGLVGVRLDSNIIPVGEIDAAAPDLHIHQNNLTGHGAPGQFGVEVRAPFPGFLVDARQNWWGIASGPEDPLVTMPSDVIENVSLGVNYDPWLRNRR